ncbi:hypothetical protein [Actinokineospora diospyrosa]|nr:hypothetical protein [Actinokineospora diospyrosa]
MTQRKDLDNLLVVDHAQQSQHGEGMGDGESVDVPLSRPLCCDVDGA